MKRIAVAVVVALVLATATVPFAGAGGTVEAAPGQAKSALVVCTKAVGAIGKVIIVPTHAAPSVLSHGGVFKANGCGVQL